MYSYFFFFQLPRLKGNKMAIVKAYYDNWSPLIVTALGAREREREVGLQFFYQELPFDSNLKPLTSVSTSAIAWLGVSIIAVIISKSLYTFSFFIPLIFSFTLSPPILICHWSSEDRFFIRFVSYTQHIHTHRAPRLCRICWRHSFLIRSK